MRVRRGKMVVRAGKDAPAPPLFTETLCCSMASSKLACSDFILSNSSTQQTPTGASNCTGFERWRAGCWISRPVAVKPAVEADLPLTCIANALRAKRRGALRLPMPGSPTSRYAVPRAVSFPAHRGFYVGAVPARLTNFCVVSDTR